jgi:predicted nucleic acid-binding Zn ribbon protein
VSPRGRGSGGDDRDDGAARVGDILGGLLRKLGLDEELAGQEAVARWDEVVGERIADVTRARGVSRGTLFVEVRSSAWLSELNLMRRDIMSRLNVGRSQGRIEKIVFVLGEEREGEG